MPVNNWKKVFWTIWAGQAFSILGSAAAGFAIVWWLTVETGSAMVLTMATMAVFLPQALIGPFAGVWIDRSSRKTVMIAADLLIAATSIILAIAFFIGNPPIWLIYTLLFIRGVGQSFHLPAMQAALPMFVPESELVKAGGWSGFIQSGSFMLGPVLGTFFMTVFSIPAVMLIDIIGAVIAVAALLLVVIPDPQVDPSARQHILSEMLDGWQEIKGNKALVLISIPVLLTCFIYIPLSAIFPLMTSQHFDGTAWHASLIEFLFAGGMLLSGLILGLWGGFKNKFLMINLSLLAMGVAIAASGALPSTAFWAFGILSVLMGAAGNFFNIPFIAYVQEVIPPASLGRVLTLLTSLMSLSTPLGLLVAGPFAENMGVAQWFLISGLAIMLAAVFGCLLTARLKE
ncbi:MAG: enterobactin exporter EntS [Bacteroidetes bacterium ADurb.Bin139]|nr:MAG: enterobactin exporter EntS [Bacteroidetes bacterium ADurb.Bin139]